MDKFSEKPAPSSADNSTPNMSTEAKSPACTYASSGYQMSNSPGIPKVPTVPR